MRLLADENFNRQIADGLLARDPGLDLVDVRHVGLAAADDPTVLEWAAAEDRVLLTHDRRTIPGFAYARVPAGLPMPGVFLVSDAMPVGQAIDEILLAVHCLSREEGEGRVRYFPMSARAGRRGTLGGGPGGGRGGRDRIMPSRFPGMDPYLEQDDVWHDFHERFLPAAAEAIGAQVQPDDIVKIDEHVYVHEPPSEPRRLLGRADLGVASARPAQGPPAAAVGLIDAPARVRLPAVDIERESFIEIRDRRSRALVCLTELLSPANKRPGPDRERYLAERSKVLASPAHLVEIDLLRIGEPMPSQDRPACAYSVVVSRAEERPLAGFWPIGLRDRLPVIPIPLRPTHPDARLDLQALMDRIRDAAGYVHHIYEGAPSPALSQDAAWARSLRPPEGPGGGGTPAVEEPQRS